MIVLVTKRIAYTCDECGSGNLTPVKVDGRTNELFEAICNQCGERIPAPVERELDFDEYANKEHTELEHFISQSARCLECDWAAAGKSVAGEVATHCFKNRHRVHVDTCAEYRCVRSGITDE